MKGGEKFLSKNILGVEFEFQSIYENQPLFSDVDFFIRNRFGLQIQDVSKSYWKYPEGIHIGAIKGQLIFGDALYFRPPQEIVSWCSNLPKDEASRKLHMACLMGIVYGYLDYSLCILNQPSINEFLEKEIIDQWMALILHYGKSLHFQKGINIGATRRVGLGRLSHIFNFLYRMLQFTNRYEGWASCGQSLGTRKKFGIFS